VDIVPDPLLHRRSGSARNRTRTSGRIKGKNLTIKMDSGSIENVARFRHLGIKQIKIRLTRNLSAD
jgi:hypothetical protein